MSLKPRPSAIVRVYRKEPVLMHTTAPAARGTTARARAHRYVTEHLTDRVQECDIRTEIEPDDQGITARVVVDMPVLKGEFKNHDFAREWLCRQAKWDHCDVEIVVKNSTRDHEIRTFGVKRQL